MGNRMLKRLSPEELQNKMREDIEKHGFCVHFVIYTAKPPSRRRYQSIHTHGLEQSQGGHYDLEITLPVSGEDAAEVISNVVDKIKKGKEFRDGDIVSGILVGYDVKFVKRKESGRDILRILLPDRDGRYPEHADCDPRFSEQDLFIDVANVENDDSSDCGGGGGLPN